MADGSTVQIELPLERLGAFCERWKLKGLWIFGSALREDFGPDSDIDLLYDYGPEASIGLDELWQMEEELEKLFGRRVDFVSKRGLEQDVNWLRRERILSSAVPIDV